MRLFGKQRRLPDPELITITEGRLESPNANLFRCVGRVAAQGREIILPEFPFINLMTNTFYRLPPMMVEGILDFAEERAPREGPKKGQNCVSFALMANRQPVPDNFGTSDHQLIRMEFVPTTSSILRPGTTIRITPPEVDPQTPTFTREEHWAVAVGGVYQNMLHVPGFRSPLAIEPLSEIQKKYPGNVSIVQFDAP